MQQQRILRRATGHNVRKRRVQGCKCGGDCWRNPADSDPTPDQLQPLRDLNQALRHRCIDVRHPGNIEDDEARPPMRNCFQQAFVQRLCTARIEISHHRRKEDAIGNRNCRRFQIRYELDQSLLFGVALFQFIGALLRQRQRLV